MNMALVAFLFIIYYCVHGIASQYTVQLEISSESVQLGGNVTLKCLVVQKERGSLYVKWIKRIDGMERPMVIATSNYVDEPFQGTGRFTAAAKFDTPGDYNKVSFLLFITNVQSSDSGDIGCELPRGSFVQFKHLTVQVPVQSMTLSAISSNLSSTSQQQVSASNTSNQTLSFKEGESVIMTCSVIGSIPAPNVTVYIGDTDVTAAFQNEVKLVRSGNVEGLQSIGYHVTAQNANFVIDYDKLDGKTITCSASVPDNDFPVRIVTAKLDVMSYKPRFDCQKLLKVGHMQKDVNITCHVRAKPAANSWKIYWKDRNGRNSSYSGLADHYRAEMVLDNITKELTMNLNIDRAIPGAFRRYYFEAENKIGNAVHSVELRRDPRLEGSQLLGGSCRNTIFHATVYLLTFTVLFRAFS